MIASDQIFFAKLWKAFSKILLLKIVAAADDFRAFLDPEPVQEVKTSEIDNQSSGDSSAETDIPDESQEVPVDTQDTPEEQNVTEEPPESISEDVVEPPAEETNSVQESPSAVPPSTVAGTGEIVFEQVDGPKVEVISEDGEVTKIVVHLASDKILEINCSIEFFISPFAFQLGH